MSDTTDRGYFYPTGEDDPRHGDEHLQKAMESVDADVTALEKHSNDSDMQVKQDLMEYVRHEIQELETDLANGLAAAKDYTDDEIAKLEERLTAKIDALPIDDTSHLPVLGPWAILTTRLTEPAAGFISGDYFGTTAADYNDMRNWDRLIVNLLDSTFHSNHYWENVKPDWVISYVGETHQASFKATSEATRNGDTSLSINVEWIDGTTTDPAELGFDGYIHAHEKTTPHFPIRGGI